MSAPEIKRFTDDLMLIAIHRDIQKQEYMTTALSPADPVRRLGLIMGLRPYERWIFIPRFYDFIANHLPSSGVPDSPERAEELDALGHELRESYGYLLNMQFSAVHGVNPSLNEDDIRRYLTAITDASIELAGCFMEDKFNLSLVRGLIQKHSVLIGATRPDAKTLDELDKQAIDTHEG